ncbi:invasion associated locus B family protein [Kordiimonas marina]|uniref:invasion associated locus B family protein n=1 Tax=Kordiimonas marina TaxID=2872312 RepID=UPI001FF488B2|nr:invasion associated locus B family protein [Kordiimonas marina]MCJ9428101.1 invasion associated locus B family protein [Kordiimonas marina]
MQTRTVTLFAALILGLSLPASAAAGRELLGSYRDWDAIVSKHGNTKVCYMISMPKKSVASRSGASRGDIYITISHRPAAHVKNEVNVIVGYPLKEGSTMKVRVDGRHQFELFTEGEGAWAYDPKDDTAMVNAMRAGSHLVAYGVSQRGTKTTDTYSLSGFTAAYNAITKACN